MRVRFKPLHGQDSVVVPDVIDVTGEPVYFTREDPERDLSDADAAIVLTNPNFVDAASGVNPLVAAADAAQDAAAAALAAVPAPAEPPAFIAPAHDAEPSEG